MLAVRQSDSQVAGARGKVCFFCVWEGGSCGRVGVCGRVSIPVECVTLA